MIAWRERTRGRDLSIGGEDEEFEKNLFAGESQFRIRMWFVKQSRDPINLSEGLLVRIRSKGLIVVPQFC